MGGRVSTPGSAYEMPRTNRTHGLMLNMISKKYV